MLRTNRITLLLAALSFVIGCRQAAGDDAMTLAENGEAKAVVVVAGDAGEPERHAASELADFLQQITGTRFEIVGHPAAGKSRLLVGPKAAGLADADFSTDGLGTDGMVIRTAGNDLILAGGHPRGTLYAVYTFLQDELGCRWWSSTESTIPRKPNLEVGKLNVRYVPQLEKGGMIFSGKSPRAEIYNILELPAKTHPYFIGTQAHPELTSRPLRPHPMFLGLVHAALRRAYADYDEPLEFDPPHDDSGPPVETTERMAGSER